MIFLLKGVVAYRRQWQAPTPEHRRLTIRENPSIKTTIEMERGELQWSSPRLPCKMTDLLIITNSYDVTTDLLLDRLREGGVFRLNFDQFDKYEICFDQSGFRIAAPDGRTVLSEKVAKAYWRKPFSAEPDAQSIGAANQYVHAEWRYLLNEIVNLLWADNRFVLVEPFAERRTGKLLQLLRAKSVFHVPPYEFVSNYAPSAEEAVVKSLSNESVNGKVLYTTRIHPNDLDRHYPWFLQQYVPATHDITVVFVRGKMFAFRLERDFLGDSPDWRRHISPDQRWTFFSLPTDVLRAVSIYMDDLKLSFGRLDLLLDDEERYWFCEVNPNGQFAWLDLSGEFGLLQAVANEISPSTEHHSIQHEHPLASSVHVGRPATAV